MRDCMEGKDQSGTEKELFSSSQYSLSLTQSGTNSERETQSSPKMEHPIHFPLHPVYTFTGYVSVSLG